MTTEYQNLTLDEYFRVEEASEERYEFVRGQLRLMTGATEAHNLITGNLFGLLYQHLKGGHCHAYSQGMKLQVQAADCIYYPDVMVSCGTVDPRATYDETAVLVAEVLSRSTRKIDEVEKLNNCRQLPSLRYYLLIEQDRQELRLYTRTTNNDWELSTLSKTDDVVLDLRSDAQFRCSVADIYDRVTLQV